MFGIRLRLGPRCGDQETDALRARRNLRPSGLLTGLGGGSQEFSAYDGLRGLTNEQYQDRLIVVPGPVGRFAIAGFGLIRRRRRG